MILYTITSVFSAEFVFKEYRILPALSPGDKNNLYKKKTDPESGPSLGSCRQGVVDGIGHRAWDIQYSFTGSCSLARLQYRFSVLYDLFIATGMPLQQKIFNFMFLLRKKTKVTKTAFTSGLYL
jgi:hypothetical protein